MARYTRTIKDVYADHADKERQRQDTLRELARKEQRASEDRDLQAAKAQVEEHRERHPAPAKQDRYGRIADSGAVEEEPAETSSAWLEYERAAAVYEERRRRFAAMGLTLREGPPSPPREGDPREHMTDAERHRRAQLGIPPKVPGHGRPPWA